MGVGLIWSHRPTADGLERLVADQAARSVTYAEVGATRELVSVPGYRDDRWSIELGAEEAAFQRGCRGLRSWAAHRGAGLEVSPAEAPIATGQTVALAMPVAGLSIVVACRIVWVIDEVDCFGFGYGTLPAHAESGEEAFLVRRDSQRVMFEVRAFSRPAHPLARVGAPLARWLQLRVTQRYLEAMRSWVSMPA